LLYKHVETLYSTKQPASGTNLREQIDEGINENSHAPAEDGLVFGEAVAKKREAGVFTQLA